MDMTKEYRAELRAIRAQKRWIEKTLRKAMGDVKRETARIYLALRKHQRLASRGLARLNKRQAILEGRLG